MTASSRRVIAFQNRVEWSAEIGVVPSGALQLDLWAMALLAHESWMQRNSAEGREGTAAFRERRKPAWYPGA
jgi:hypothetical protein